MIEHTRKYWISTQEGIPEQTRKILNEYLLRLKLANKAETTISKYRLYLERFCSECLVELDSLTSEDVLKWVNKFSGGKKDSTVISILSILTTFFNFCFEENYMNNRLIKRRRVPKVSQRLPRYLTDREYYPEIITAELGQHRNIPTSVSFRPFDRSRFEEATNLLIKKVDELQRTAEVSVIENKNTV